MPNRGLGLHLVGAGCGRWVGEVLDGGLAGGGLGVSGGWWLSIVDVKDLWRYCPEGRVGRRGHTCKYPSRLEGFAMMPESLAPVICAV